MMRASGEVTPDELRQAHDAADVVASEVFRPYLPGRLLPLLIARFRDDTAEVLGLELPPLPRRSQTRAAKLAELTTSELATLWGAVDALVQRFAPCMDDPELPRLLGSLREELAAERDERAAIADDFTVKAKAS